MYLANLHATLMLGSIIKIEVEPIVKILEIVIEKSSMLK